MDGETAEKKEEVVKVRKADTGRVIIVQTLVCAFIIFLIVLAGRLSPDTFEFIKKEYNEIMAVDMTPAEIADSAAKAVQGAVSTKVSAKEPEEAEQESIAAAETSETEKTADKKDGAIAVMASLDNKEITVPVHGRITSEYGYRTNPISGEYALHSGIDIAAKEGTDILAAYSGVVKSTGTGKSSGKYVVLLHSDGSETFYYHCSKILVKEDDIVRAGDVIALVGTTGWSTGPHLHFGVRENGKTVNPRTVLPVKDGRV